MLSFLIYEGKVAVALLVFYLFYRFLLKKETFHRFNRAVLVGTALLSFLLPFCIITIHKSMEMPSESNLEIVELGDGTTVVNGLPAGVLEGTAPWWPTVLAVLFFVGVAFVLVRVAVGPMGLIFQRLQRPIVALHPAVDVLSVCPVPFCCCCDAMFLCVEN